EVHLFSTLHLADIRPLDTRCIPYPQAKEAKMADRPNRVGQQLGNYRLIALVGEGGFAEVYLGQHVQIDTQQAAIKVLYLTGVDPHKFRQEAQTIASLKHPNIIRLFDFSDQQDMPYLVMDYAPNGSLGTRHAAGEKVPLVTVV